MCFSMISCNDCVFCWDTGDLCLIVYLKATWQMEQQSLEPLRPSPSHAPATFFTSDAVLNVQEAFRRCFLTAPLNAETIHDNLRFCVSFIMSSRLHIIFRVKVRLRCMDPFLPRHVCRGFDFGSDCLTGRRSPSHPH